MTFQVRIQNLGKLADATVRVGPLTVLAGVNNTGKSFFSKALYSAFEAMNAKHALVAYEVLRKPVWGNLNSFYSTKIMDGGEGVPPFPDDLFEGLAGALNLMRSGAHTCSVAFMDGEFVREDNPYSELADAAGRVKAAYARLLPVMGERLRSLPAHLRLDLLPGMSHNIEALCELGKMNGLALVSRGLRHKIVENLSENFQVSKFSDLKNNKHDEMVISIDGAGRFGVNRDDEIAFKVSNPGLVRWREFSRVIFLDSPTFWRIQPGLRNARRNRVKFSYNDRVEMDRIPKYFYDLDELLQRGELSGEVAFPEVSRRLTSSEVIGGEVVLSGDRTLHFREAERIFPLSSTAMGVVNLGLLALLIERKLVDKGTFLFIDEPESNLHPAWQVEMVRALFALARGGVNVVMATHSVDIVKYLEVHAQEHPETKELVALNHFTPEGVVDGGKDFEEQLAGIMIELTKPFHDLRMREMRAFWS